jgi:hypothetical protein
VFCAVEKVMLGSSMNFRNILILLFSLNPFYAFSDKNYSEEEFDKLVTIELSMKNSDLQLSETPNKIIYKDKNFQLTVEQPYSVYTSYSGTIVNSVTIVPKRLEDIYEFKKTLEFYKTIFDNDRALVVDQKYIEKAKLIEIFDINKEDLEFNHRGTAYGTVGLWLTDENCVILMFEVYLGRIIIPDKVVPIDDYKNLTYMIKIQAYSIDKLKEIYFPSPLNVSEEERQEIQNKLDRLFGGK